jgi:RNA polymerase sigma-54 factor
VPAVLQAAKDHRPHAGRLPAKEKDRGVALEIKTGLSLQTKQILSQVQMESLNILSMSVTELQEFLQNEEIENPLIEYSADGRPTEMPVAYRDSDRFYGSRSGDDSGDQELYQIEDGTESVEELIYPQLPWKEMGDKERAIVDFCVQSLENSGYLLVSAEEIAEALSLPVSLTEEVLGRLKMLEPRGIFASGLEECLLLQIKGMEKEELLSRIISGHLKDIAEGRISAISRELKLTSMEVRKLIQVIKGLNPRPLNGYGRERAQYIFPDILLSCQNGQWTMEFNDRRVGNVQINEFYVRMMETAQDQELKNYFEEKLKRARFIMNALDQRHKTLQSITEGIINRQSGYLLGREPLKPMTLEEIAKEKDIHKSTVSRAIKDKYILAPAGCILIRDLFTSGVQTGDAGEMSRNAVKEKLRELVEKEDKKKPFSDERLAQLLEEDGILVSRRTVAKYRMELGIGGVFQRKA